MMGFANSEVESGGMSGELGNRSLHQGYKTVKVRRSGRILEEISYNEHKLNINFFFLEFGANREHTFFLFWVFDFSDSGFH